MAGKLVGLLTIVTLQQAAAWAVEPNEVTNAGWWPHAMGLCLAGKETQKCTELGDAGDGLGGARSKCRGTNAARKRAKGNSADANRAGTLLSITTGVVSDEMSYEEAAAPQLQP